MVSGVANINPIGPHSHVQKVAEVMTAIGESPELCP